MFEFEEALKMIKFEQRKKEDDARDKADRQNAGLSAFFAEANDFRDRHNILVDIDKIGVVVQLSKDDRGGLAVECLEQNSFSIESYGALTPNAEYFAGRKADAAGLSKLIVKWMLGITD